jgi:hypothetical protein
VDSVEITIGAANEPGLLQTDASTDCSDIAYPTNNSENGKHDAGPPISRSEPSEQDGSQNHISPMQHPGGKSQINEASPSIG